MFSKFFRVRPERDDKSQKVYVHRYPRQDIDSKRAYKVGVTENCPHKRKDHYAHKHNLPMLKQALTIWKYINRDGDRLDRDRFDQKLKKNLAIYRIESMPGKEFYRGTDKQILGTINRTLKEHQRSSNR